MNMSIKKEIGSDFWDVPKCEQENGVFPNHTQWYISGRSALAAIIQDIRDAHTVAMPSWCCDSMIKPFIDAGITVSFYSVYKKNNDWIQEIDTDCDILFVMDYFGYAMAPMVKHPCIIRDVTHSIFFLKHNEVDYFFGSLRKWCGVWTGGYAWTWDGRKLPTANGDDHEYVRLRSEAMNEKARYIYGNESNQNNKHYLEIYNQAEMLLDDTGVCAADKRDVHLAQKLDINFLKKRRRENAKILMEAFHDWLIFPTLEEESVPMFVPVLVPNGKRNALRKHLIDHEIYCPIHWPLSEYHKPDQKTETIYENELSLVCDQRYTEEDMARIVKTIQNF